MRSEKNPQGIGHDTQEKPYAKNVTFPISPLDFRLGIVHRKYFVCSEISKLKILATLMIKLNAIKIDIQRWCKKRLSL